MIFLSNVFISKEITLKTTPSSSASEATANSSLAVGDGSSSGGREGKSIIITFSSLRALFAAVSSFFWIAFLRLVSWDWAGDSDMLLLVVAG